MREIHEVMNTVKDFTAEDATVIMGTVIEENMQNDLRVTVVATGLGELGNGTQTTQRPLAIINTRTGTNDAPSADGIDWTNIDIPAVTRRNGRREAVQAMQQSGVDELEIPVFLRKQAD